MDKGFYARVLPFMAEWPEALQARFAEGMALLQRTPVRAIELPDSIGIVLVGEGEGQVDALYTSRVAALFRGSVDGFSDEQMRAIGTRPPEGSITVLIIAHRADNSHGYAVIQVPITTVIVGLESPGSSEGN